MTENTPKAEESVSESLRSDLEAQEPTDGEKEALREEHQGHLVRDTTSKLSIDSPEIAPGMEIDAQAEIPDTYCFGCEEWIGLSGVNLRGKPRSRSDAYYLGGMPTDVLHAKDGVTETLNDLSEKLIERVENVSDRKEALRFIETELETMQEVESEQ